MYKKIYKYLSTNIIRSSVLHLCNYDSISVHYTALERT